MDIQTGKHMMEKLSVSLHTLVIQMTWVLVKQKVTRVRTQSSCQTGGLCPRHSNGGFQAHVTVALSILTYVTRHPNIYIFLH